VIAKAQTQRRKLLPAKINELRAICVTCLPVRGKITPSPYKDRSGTKAGKQKGSGKTNAC